MLTPSVNAAITETCGLMAQIPDELAWTSAAPAYFQPMNENGNMYAMALNIESARPMAASSARVNARERLIVALDVPSVPMAWEMVRRLEGAVTFFKVGPWLIVVKGTEALLDGLLESRINVFIDTKGQDIPETMRAGVAAAADRGIRFLTIHGNGEVSDEAMKAAVSGKSASLQVFSVTVLTSLDQSDLTATGYGALNKVVTERAEKAIRCGCDGVIASAHEVRLIKELALQHGRPDFLVITPGIRPAGTMSEDHKRPATPDYAISQGADYLVVGRPIIHAANPAESAAKIIAEMQTAFDRRS